MLKGILVALLFITGQTYQIREEPALPTVDVPGAYRSRCDQYDLILATAQTLAQHGKALNEATELAKQYSQPSFANNDLKYNYWYQGTRKKALERDMKVLKKMLKDQLD